MRNLAAFRYAFERWLASAYNVPSAADTGRNRETGAYLNPHVKLAWDAFSAGRAYIGPRAIQEMVLGDLYPVDVTSQMVGRDYRA